MLVAAGTPRGWVLLRQGVSIVLAEHAAAPPRRGDPRSRMITSTSLRPAPGLLFITRRLAKDSSVDDTVGYG